MNELRSRGSKHPQICELSDPPSSAKSEVWHRLAWQPGKIFGLITSGFLCAHSSLSLSLFEAGQVRGSFICLSPAWGSTVAASAGFIWGGIKTHSAEERLALFSISLQLVGRTWKRCFEFAESASSFYTGEKELSTVARDREKKKTCTHEASDRVQNQGMGPCIHS